MEPEGGERAEEVSLRADGGSSEGNGSGTAGLEDRAGRCLRKPPPHTSWTANAVCPACCVTVVTEALASPEN